MIVLFAQGAHWEDCYTVYGMIGDHSNIHFESYRQHVMQPRFWVGTVFFIWASMAYGYAPTFESTADFIGKYFKYYMNKNMPIVFFYQQ
jgi:hypothetical protein